MHVHSGSDVAPRWHEIAVEWRDGPPVLPPCACCPPLPLAPGPNRSHLCTQSHTSQMLRNSLLVSRLGAVASAGARGRARPQGPGEVRDLRRARAQLLSRHLGACGLASNALTWRLSKQVHGPCALFHTSLLPTPDGHGPCDSGIFMSFPPVKLAIAAVVEFALCA